MICQICHRPFTPVKDEQLCVDCAKEEWRKKQPDAPPRTRPLYKPRENTEVCQVVWIKNDTIFLYIRIVPDNFDSEFRYVYTSNDVPTMNVRILTNFTNGSTEKKDYFFEKFPTFVDSLTGTDRIAINSKDIIRIENNTIHLTDGSTIRVQFR